MIKEVYLFTNRNTLIFDETGNQVHDLQARINWDCNYRYSEQDALGTILADNPQFYISKFKEWHKPISADEFCSLLGHGPWYYDKYRKAVADDDNQ